MAIKKLILKVLKLHSCNFENFQNYSYLLITNRTRGRAISYTNFPFRPRLRYSKMRFYQAGSTVLLPPTGVAYKTDMLIQVTSESTTYR